MRKQMEQYEKCERQIIDKVSSVVLRVWSTGCYHVVLNDPLAEEAIACWEGRYRWIKDVNSLAKNGSGQIPRFPRTLVSGCDVCFYRHVAKLIR